MQTVVCFECECGAQHVHDAATAVWTPLTSSACVAYLLRLSAASIVGATTTGMSMAPVRRWANLRRRHKTKTTNFPQKRDQQQREDEDGHPQSAKIGRMSPKSTHTRRPLLFKNKTRCAAGRSTHTLYLDSFIARNPHWIDCETSWCRHGSSCSF